MRREPDDAKVSRPVRQGVGLGHGPRLPTEAISLTLCAINRVSFEKGSKMSILKKIKNLFTPFETTSKERGINPSDICDLNSAIARSHELGFTIIPESDPIKFPAFYREFEAYYPECELQTKRWIVENVKPDWTVFDCGANIGYLSILFSKLALQGRVYAFEPTETITYLNENLKFNSCNNVIPLKIALGAIEGSLEENIYRIWGKGPERKKYDFSTIDKVVEDLKIKSLECIKIDVDSFDFEVLRGAINTLNHFNPWVIVELNHSLALRQTTLADVLEWLYGNGYKNAHILDGENFLLKKENSLSIKGKNAIIISFESRPILLPPPFVKGNEVLNVFEFRPQSHNNARVENDQGSIHVFHEGARWDYVVTFEKLKRFDLIGSVIIEIDIDLTMGTLGVGCLDFDQKEFKGKEVELYNMDAVQTLSFCIEKIEEISCLVVRNINSLGAHSSFRIHSIRVFEGIKDLYPSSRLTSLKKDLISLQAFSEVLSLIGGRQKENKSEDLLIRVVSLDEVGNELNFLDGFQSPSKIYRHSLLDLDREPNDFLLFSYLYKNLSPTNHLEINPPTGINPIICAKSCNADIWRGSYSEEDIMKFKNVDRTEAYVKRRVNEEGLFHRFHEFSLENDWTEKRHFFDSILIYPSQSLTELSTRMEIVFDLLKPGGVLLLHGFCPDPEAMKKNYINKLMMEFVIDNSPFLSKIFEKFVWINPSWIFLGVKKLERNW